MCKPESILYYYCYYYYCQNKGEKLKTLVVFDLERKV